MGNFIILEILWTVNPSHFVHCDTLQCSFGLWPAWRNVGLPLFPQSLALTSRAKVLCCNPHELQDPFPRLAVFVL